MESHNELNMSGGAPPLREFTTVLESITPGEADNILAKKVQALKTFYNTLTDIEKKTANRAIQASIYRQYLYEKIPEARPANGTYSFKTTGNFTDIIKYKTEPDGTVKESIFITGVKKETLNSNGDKQSINPEPDINPNTNNKIETVLVYTIDKSGKLTTNKETKETKPYSISKKSKDRFIIDTGVDYSINKEQVKEDQFLLELFDRNINNLVIDLKKHFGNNNEKVNEVVAAISTITAGIKTQIDTGVSRIAATTNDYGPTKLINVKDAAKGIYESELKNAKKDTLFAADATREASLKKIKDLDSKNTEYNPDLEATDVDLATRVGLEKVQQRLINCQGLELIHLGLYENFMKTGAFTLTLFEKYKYVTNVMLYLLKNLVNKPGKIEGENVNIYSETESIVENGCATENKIKLPTAIIKNIAQLVAEQGKIQGTIDTISTELDKTNMDNIMDYHVGDIQNNVQKTNSPEYTSQRNIGTPTFTRGPIQTSPPKLAL